VRSSALRFKLLSATINQGLNVCFCEMVCEFFGVVKVKVMFFTRIRLCSQLVLIFLEADVWLCRFCAYEHCV
jgi:hypothetical protein